MKKFLVVLCIVAAVISVLVLAGSFLCYRIVFSVPEATATSAYNLSDSEQFDPYLDIIPGMISHALSIPYEEVHIKSHDGFDLFGRYYETRKGAPVQIMFHGYHGVAERDFCGGLPEALAGGFNVILVDQRAHGRSGGKSLSFGVLERYDCAAWTRYAVERFGSDSKIMLYGISMGAATVLMASELDLPSNVVGIVADCGYSSPKAIICKVMEDNSLPQFLIYPLVRLGGIIWGHFDIESSSATEALRNCRIPVLFIHGGADGFVPCDMSRENYQSCSSELKRLVVIDGAGHGISYLKDTEAYMKAVSDFHQVVL